MDVLGHKLPGWKAPNFEGLEKIIILVGNETKGDLPNSTVWVFDANAPYHSEILGNDVGCGMTAYVISKIDEKKAADIIADYLKDANILGRGNHFVDICSSIHSPDSANKEDYNILLIHTDGKRNQHKAPKTIDEAIERVSYASEFRKKLGKDLATQIGAKIYEFLGDWPHNSVSREGGKVVYRKGAIKLTSRGVHIFPISLGYTVLLYTVDDANRVPYRSAPHGAGRSGPISKTKVSTDDIAQLEQLVYVPPKINRDSLRSEHPKCYNDLAASYEFFQPWQVILGETKILAYVGKV